MPYSANAFFLFHRLFYVYRQKILFCRKIKDFFQGGNTMAHLSEAAVAKINEICDRYVSEKPRS